MTMGLYAGAAEASARRRVSRKATTLFILKKNLGHNSSPFSGG